MILLHQLRTRNFKQLAEVTLTFPQSGTVLIEGHNEAGKSSVFEAVYFALYGKPLIGDRDFRLEHLRAYGTDELVVELDFLIDGRPYSVSRRLKGQQRASLILQKEDGTTETINALNEVNRRLVEELGITAESLLNTCFVEQKRLDRLEGQDTRERQVTINELLNLRVLTHLQNEFRVSNQELAFSRTLKGRVMVAKLDDKRSRLEVGVGRAYRCLVYSRLRQSVDQRTQWQQEIDTARVRQAVITERREQITAQFQECVRLRSVLEALKNALPLHVRGWQEQETLLAQAQSRVGQLQTLADTLPQRAEQLVSRRKMAESLAALETWEAEYTALKHDLEAKRKELEEFGVRQAEWDAGETRRANDRQALAQSGETLRAAELEWEARQTADRRFLQMLTLLSQVGACDQAAKAQEESESRLKIAQAEAGRLPELQKQRAVLEDLEARLRQWDDDKREQVRVQAALETLLQQQADQRTRWERLALLLANMDRLERELEEAGAAERQGAACVRETEVRTALENWAEAAERGGEFSPETTADGGLTARLREAAAEQEAAAQAVQQTARRRFPGYGLLAMGVMAGIAGTALGQMSTGIVLAVVFIALGGALTAVGQRAIRTTQERAHTVQLAFATLEGERKSAEMRVQSDTEQRRLWAQREIAARETLSRLETLVPATPAAARSQAQTLAALTSAEAQTAYRVAAEGVSRLRGEQAGARRTKESENARLQQTDPEALTEQIAEAQEKVDRLKAALTTADALPNIARNLGIEADVPKMQLALEQARKAVSVAEEHKASLSDLKAEYDAKGKDVQREVEQGKALAEALGCSTAGPAEWRAAAEAEREELRHRKTLTPNPLLESAVSTARQTLLAAEKRLAGLEVEQARLQETLTAKPCAAIIGEQAVLEEAFAAAKQHIEPLRNVRPDLEHEGLPSEAYALNLHLAAHSETLRHDTATAVQLPTAQQEQEQRQRAVATKKAEFQRAWQVCLSSPAPEVALLAQQALSRWQTDFERRLAEQDEPALRMQEKALQKEDTGLGNSVATLQHRQEEAARQQQSLRQELGMEAAETLKTVCERLPDLLRSGEHTPDEWEATLTGARDALAENRSLRKAQAEIYGVGEEALLLPTAEAELAAADQEIAVKKRAGEIIEKTRQALIARVMPLTMQNVAQLLPLLTEGRYGDVKWDEASSSLEVYDTRARAYQRKRIFSGGARDQISLALRLGFALATLPGEHNIRPGWLFLDEPLSSFDRIRTLALVDLLTKGLIRRKFDQIFLVSHSEAFDPALFDYQVRMESGSVIESTLPGVAA